MLGHQLDSMVRNHHSHKCVIIEKYGNIEVGIERMGGEMGQEKYKNPIWNQINPLISKWYVGVDSPTFNLDENATLSKLSH